MNDGNRVAHDKFIRDLMSRKPVVQDFLRYYLDQELVNLLDLSTLEIKKDTFVDEELVEHFSDILRHASVASQLKFRNGKKTQVYVFPKGIASPKGRRGALPLRVREQ